MVRWVALLIALAAIGQVDVPTIIERSVQANNRDWQGASAYSFSERDVQNGQTRTLEVTMILGSPCQRLDAVNGVTITC
jgi:hypothetical protein